MTAFVPMERVSIVTPLAVRFRDAATGQYVSDRLSVVVYPSSGTESRRTGIANSSSVFVFHDLPGFREFERGAGDEKFWNTPWDRSEFVVELSDRARRFLPYSVRLMAPQRGIATIDVSSPLDFHGGTSDAHLPLYSAPGRPIPAGVGVFRAELVDVNGSPAAWALVEATASQRTFSGLADERGRVTVPLPYPKPVVTLGSLATMNPPLRQQAWRVDVTIRYRRRHSVPEVPDLLDILTQPIAEASVTTSPATPWTGGTLHYERDLVPENAVGKAVSLWVNPL